MRGISSYLQHQHLSHAESSKAVICDSLLVEAEVLEFVVASFPACLAQTDLYSLGMLWVSPHDPTSHLQPLVNQSWVRQEHCGLMTNASCGMLDQQHGMSSDCRLCLARVWSKSLVLPEQFGFGACSGIGSHHCPAQAMGCPCGSVPIGPHTMWSPGRGLPASWRQTPEKEQTFLDSSGQISSFVTGEWMNSSHLLPGLASGQLPKGSPAKMLYASVSTLQEKGR